MNRIYKMLIADLILVLVLVTNVTAIDVSSCRLISSPGYYKLTKNIVDSGKSVCINITSKDVIFDGTGHIIDGIGNPETIGMKVSSSKILKNVTVKNLNISDWGRGIYYQNVQDGSIIDNNASFNFIGIQLFFSENNTLIRNTAIEAGGFGETGFLLDISENNKLIKNRASSLDLSTDGITLNMSNNNILRYNNLTSNNRGILMKDSKNNRLSNNIVFRNDIGIVLSTSSNNYLNDNDVSFNFAPGIILDYSGNNTLTNNNAAKNSGAGIMLYVSYNNTIDDNNANLNGVTGIFLIISANNTLVNNNLSGHDFKYGCAEICSGIEISGGWHNIIKSNNISNNDDGISLINSINNMIFNNYFNNTNNVGYDDRKNTWNVTKTPGINIIGGQFIGGNFWSNYNGIDIDGDGLGDTLLPYNSSGNIINGGDYHPLMISGGISGYKINDINNNGRWDEGEKGISNWSIILIKTGKVKIRKQISTDTNGYYIFKNLPAGRYIIKEEMKKGFVPTISPVKHILLKQGDYSINNNFTNKRKK